MKQKILDALKTKFPGVSDAILDRVANKLAQTATTAEQVQTAVDGVTFQQVLESYGDARANQAQQTAVHNYEQKYGLKDGVKQQSQQQQQQQQTGSQQQTVEQQGGKPNEDIPAWAKAIIDTNKTIVDRMNRLDSERITTTRRQQIDKLIEGLPDNLKKAYGRTPVEGISDEDFNTLVSEITNEVKDISSQVSQHGAVFGRPTQQGRGGNGQELSEQQVKAISQRGAASGNDQPF